MMASADNDIAQDVVKYGWVAISIDDSDPPFTYTCGLMTTFGHPELIIFGLERRLRYDILAMMSDELKEGKSFKQPNTYNGILQNGKVAVRIVDDSHHSSYLGYAMGYHRHAKTPSSLQALQVFWPDANGNLPFEALCDPIVSSCQPRLFIPRVSNE